MARRARAARAPKAKSCATSRGTSSETSCAASFTCPSFMCHLRAGVCGGARVQVAARRSMPFCPLKRAAFAASFTCPPFTCRPPLPLGLPHQHRASNVQRALGVTMKKPLARVSQGRGLTGLCSAQVRCGVQPGVALGPGRAPPHGPLKAAVRAVC